MEAMCTAIVSVEPGGPLLLAGIRDELADRAWQPPAAHWPEYPGVLGGLDLLAGGTWLAVGPAAPRVSCVLNGRGRPPLPGRAAAGSRGRRAAARRAPRVRPVSPADRDPADGRAVELGRRAARRAGAAPGPARDPQQRPGQRPGRHGRLP